MEKEFILRCGKEKEEIDLRYEIEEKEVDVNSYFLDPESVIGWRSGFREAIQSQNMKTLKKLLKSGLCDINFKPSFSGEKKEGHSVIMQGLLTKNYELVKLLIKNGADVTDAEGSKWTAPIYFAATLGADFIDLFVSALYTSKEKKDMKKNEKRWTLYHEQAQMYENRCIIKSLLRAGVPFDLHCPISDETPLMICVKRKKRKMAKLFIDAGADINKHCGGSMIHIAVQKRDIKMVKLLITSKRCDLSPSTLCYGTVLDIWSSLYQNFMYQNFSFALAQCNWDIFDDLVDLLEILLDAMRDDEKCSTLYNSFISEELKPSRPLFSNKKDALKIEELYDRVSKNRLRFSREALLLASLFSVFIDCPDRLHMSYYEFHECCQELYSEIRSKKKYCNFSLPVFF